MNRPEAWALLNEYTKNPALIRHAQCVEAAMAHYARITGADERQWSLAGLLHDFDYERFPTPPDHTRKGAEVLRSRGCDEEVVGAILSHVDYNPDYPRDRPIRMHLFACDELCGFIYAASLVRPERLIGLEPKSVIKKLKQPSFAAAVSREDIDQGAKLLNRPIEEHIRNCIEAIRVIAADVDLLPKA